MNVHNEEQFIKACEDHSDALFRYCYFKIRDREMAKDLVQETFMRTWNYLVKGEEIENTRAFFYRILSNLIIDEYRKKKLVSLDELSASGFDPSFDEAEGLENKFDGEKAIEMLDQIPEMYREIIYMRYVEDLSIKEISEIIKEAENTIAVKVHRGLKKIREIFNENQ